MGRPRKSNLHLPKGVYEKHGRLYRVVKGKWTPWNGESQATGLLPELIDRVVELKRPQLAHATNVMYRCVAKKLARIFAEFSPRQVTPRHVAEMKVSMAAHPGTANACVSLLRVVFDYALENQLVDSNPCVGIKRLEEPKRRRLPSDVELARVHAHADKRLQIIIELLCLTGQRVNDVLRIKRTDLIEDGCAIRFVQQKTGTPLTVRNPEIRNVIARINAMDGNVRSLNLLRSEWGRTPCYRWVAQRWLDACERAGVEDLQMRDLRAKSITTTKQQGGDARAVAGHASEAMTARYIRQHDEPVAAGPSFRRVFDN